ncbi:ammonium transporter 1 [Hyaloraphidium curvatum]|nr:ammonium transporter 1 [Hyaloraphidium curvatum]
MASVEAELAQLREMVHDLQRRQSPTYQPGDTGFILMSTALVMLMLPGLGYFYSGLARAKNALSLIFICYLSMAVTALQWWLFGYSLAFSASGNPIIGNCQYCLLRGVWGDIPAGLISANTFQIFQLMFASLTVALIFGSGAERIRVVPSAILIFVWVTAVYCFIAFWTWNPDGWMKKLGVYDFAGGNVVEIASGFSALAYAFVVGKRHGESHEFKPHSVSNVALGTAMLWFGWFGFNGGSALGANDRATISIANTHFAACAGGLVWAVLDYRKNRKWSMIGFCSGAVSGLVAITPACGFVGMPAAFAVGALAGLGCHFSCDLKHYLGYDDALDVFGVHGVGGLIGTFLTGVFAEQSVAALDGAVIAGGWVNLHWIQVPIQLAGMAATAAWSFVITFGLCWVMNKIPGLHLRLDREHEELGIDQTEMGEVAFDYMESLSNTQEFGWSPAPKTAKNLKVPSEVVVQGIELAGSESAANDAASGSSSTRPAI